ncbi:MAG: hypothetical protein GY730_11555 [bacterium]|nr:hypothetical protein [bacterium]
MKNKNKLMPYLLFNITAIQPTGKPTASFKSSAPMPVTKNSTPDQILKTVSAIIASNKAKTKHQTKSVKKGYVKSVMIKPKKAVGKKPGLGKASVKPPKLSVGFQLYGGSHGRNDRVKGSSGGYDKIRRVQQGNPRKPVSLNGIKVAFKTAYPGFLFGRINAVSIARVNDEEKPAPLTFGYQAESANLLFVCSYVEGTKTIVQLENLKTKEVLDTCEIEGYKGSPGVTCLRAVGRNRVIGIFSNHLIAFDIRNKKLKEPLFFNIENVDYFDVLQNSNKYLICLKNKTIMIGEVVEDNLEEKHNFNLKIDENISSVEYKREDRILLGLYSGRTTGYELKDEGWVYYKKYIDKKSPVYTIQACNMKGIVAVSGNDNSIILVQTDGQYEQINLDKTKKQAFLDKRVIYIEFLDQIMFYACNDGSIGIANNPF